MQRPLEPGDISPEEVRRRIRWAKRRGTPAWLWPETPVEQWREALRRVEATLRGALEGRTERPALDGDPDAIGLACYTSGVGPLLGWWHAQGMIEASPAVGELLERHLRHNRHRAARMEAATVELVGAMHQREVRVAVLKGAQTAGDYFPDPATRPASDIDLLIEPTAARQAEAALQSAGYVFAGRRQNESDWTLAGAPDEPKSLRMVHGDDPWSVDLHTSLNLAVSGGGPVAELDAAKPLSSGRRWGRSPDALVLEQPLLLLHLAVHAGAGFQNLTLLRLVELHFVIRRDLAAGLLSWEAFIELGERTGSLGIAWPALKLCEELAPGTVPEAVLQDCARHVPPGVSRVVRRLTPATAQRVERASIAEHFMWASGVGGWLRHAAADLVPSRSLGEVVSIYQRRAWQVLRGGFSR